MNNYNDILDAEDAIHAEYDIVEEIADIVDSLKFEADFAWN